MESTAAGRDGSGRHAETVQAPQTPRWKVAIGVALGIVGVAAVTAGIGIAVRGRHAS